MEVESLGGDVGLSPLLWCDEKTESEKVVKP